MSVKIIAWFRDGDYAQKNSHEEYKKKAVWFWGIGSDQELYCKGQISGLHPSGWIKTSKLKLSIDMSDINRINSNLIGRI